MIDWKIIVLLIGAILLLCESTVRAQCVEAAPLAAGRLAPCTGILLPISWARTCASCKKLELPACLIDLEEAQEVGRLKISAIQAQLDKCEASFDATLAVVEAPVPWYRRPLFLLGAGAAAGITAALGVAYAVSQLP